MAKKIVPPAQAPVVKQLILIYTGDTVSALQTQNNNDAQGKLVRLGGLSALAGSVLAYEQSVTALARQRVQSSGGDGSLVKTDAEAGTLGGHPYLLLDYGGWERQGDKSGAGYVALQLQMYHDLHYAAIGTARYQQLLDEEWAQYAPLSQDPLLCSASPERQVALPRIAIVTREVHGALWGIVAVPYPPQDEKDPVAVWQDYIRQAAEALTQAGCRFSILMCKGAPQVVYQGLRDDRRFTVVMGVSPPALAESDGFGAVRADGPVMLPELAWGGQEFGTCHLIYPTSGDAPVEFNFARHQVADDLKAPLPYREQVKQAIAQHEGQRRKLLKHRPSADKMAAP